jgi:hypothetical protein
MAVLAVEGDELVVHLSAWERLAAFTDDVRAPLAAVSSATVEADPWHALRGIRAPGTGIPGVIAYGVRRLTGDRTDFAAVRGRGPAVQIELDPPSRFARWLISVADPATSVKSIRTAAGI